jgi:hypothetical protein
MDFAHLSEGGTEVEKPEKLSKYLYALEKKAAQVSFNDFLEDWQISEQEFNEIEAWFRSQGIKGYITR